MSYSNLSGAAKMYQQVGAQSGVAQADAHRLIQMLLDGALDKISVAKGFMERSDIANKGANISWAISIIDGLRLSLDQEKGGEIANNLNDLYDYMGRRLVDANIKNDPLILDEVSSLLNEVKGAWEAIPDDVKMRHNATQIAEQNK